MGLRKYYKEHSFAFKWISIAIAIKGTLFLFFAYNFIQNWPASDIINSIFIVSGDTSGYYEPVESFVNGQGYDTFCRMPGLLPVYAPLYFLFGALWGKAIIILLQFFAGALSVYFLARTAELIFKNTRIFYITFFLYAFSSFVSIWDHYGLSDSFSTSFLVFSFYLFVVYFITGNLKQLLLSGFFLAWSLFFRPINGMIFACLLLIWLTQNKNGLSHYIKNAFIFVLPCVIAIGLWTTKNFVTFKRFMPLQGSFTECYATALSKEHLAIRNLIIAWGADYQEWSVHTEAEWFFTKKWDYRKKNLFSPKVFTSYYNLDSLIWLKTNYDSLRRPVPLAPEIKTEIQRKMIASSERFVSSYRSEKPLNFYFINRLKFFQRFVFPLRLDDIPFPAFAKMNIIQKLVKFGYLLYLNFVNITGVIGIFIAFRRKNWYGIIPLTITIVLSSVLGFVEQRYLVPAYPFFCVFSAFTLFLLSDRFFKRKA